MSTVVAFTTARPRRDRRSATVIPIAAARSVRDGNDMPGRDGLSVRRARSRDERAPLQLTRRGRLVAGLLASLVLAVAIAAGVLLIGHQALAGEHAQVVPATSRIVLPGETLWSIAQDVAPGQDPRETVERLVEFNALPSAGVQAGQQVAIPGDLSQ